MKLISSKERNFHPRKLKMTTLKIPFLSLLLVSLANLNYTSAIDPTGLGHLNDVAEFETQKLSKTLNFGEEMVNSWTKLMNLFSKDEASMRERAKKHMDRGVLKSGEGSVDQIMQIRKKREELKLLQERLRTGEVPDDPEMQRKFQELYIQHHNQNSVRNDDVDLLPYKPLIQSTHSQQNQELLAPLSLKQINSTLQATSPQVNNISRGNVAEPSAFAEAQTGRVLQLQQYQLNDLAVVFESYPSNGCQNGGQLLNITQTYYQCYSKADIQNVVRVSWWTYNILTTNYTDQFTCTPTNFTRQACYCPQGFYDYQCSTQLLRQCFVNITDPPLYKGCSGKEDSPYYLYSVPGFDPCFYLNFSEVQTVKYILTCRYIDSISGISPTSENWGYNYRDVVNRETPQPFTYLSQNNRTGMKVLPSSDNSSASATDSEIQTQARITIFDWKWLSQPATFLDNITDPLVLVGQKEGSLQVDFPSLLAKDKTRDHHFVAGGRAYYEADATGGFITSFIAKGFFDQEGYQEPKASPNNTWKIVVGVLAPSAVIAIIVGVIYYQQMKKKQEKLLKGHVD